MKKLTLVLYFVLCIFIIIKPKIIAQELTFSETVDYINNKIKIGGLKNFEIDEYGNIKMTYSYGMPTDEIYKFNLNDIDKIYYEYDNSIHWACFHCSSDNKCIFHENFERKISYWKEKSIRLDTETDAKSIVKAFIYLKSLIKKDPFKP